MFLRSFLKPSLRVSIALFALVGSFMMVSIVSWTFVFGVRAVRSGRYSSLSKGPLMVRGM